MERRWTVLEILRTTTEYLDARAVPEARLSAEHLLADVLGCRRLDLYLDFDRPLEPAEIVAYRSCVRRRAAREPVQYITGTAAFRGLDLRIDRHVLVPRPETELLVGEVLAWARAEARRGRAPAGGWRIVDVGTGSGAIACAIACELEGLRWVLGTDVSLDALRVARANGAAVGSERLLWTAADGLPALRPGRSLDAVVANPPYVGETERGSLPPEIVEWEPAQALFAGPRGDEALAKIVARAPAVLRPAGLLALEIGRGQAAAVRDRIRATQGLRYLAAYRDHAGIERGVLALAA